MLAELILCDPVVWVFLQHWLRFQSEWSGLSAFAIGRDRLSLLDLDPADKRLFNGFPADRGRAFFDRRSSDVLPVLLLPVLMLPDSLEGG